MKRQRESVRDGKDGRDRLSDLPDCVLLHIMDGLHIKQVVQTCILSKRWKNLWKQLSTLTLKASHFNRIKIFDRFASRILSCRDDSVPLLNLVFDRYGITRTTFFIRLMRYAGLNAVQQLTIRARLNIKHEFLLHSIFSSRSLTFLKLSIQSPLACRSGRGDYWLNMNIPVKLPKSLELPKLKTLHLRYVTFSMSDNGYAEPFSTCNILNTLVINNCYLQDDAKVLFITNPELSSLTIGSTYGKDINKVVLSTPKLSSFTAKGNSIYELCSACNLPFLEKVNIDVERHIYSEVPNKNLVIISCLQVLANAKIMTLSASTLDIIAKDLSLPGSMSTQSPCFVRLMLLKLKKSRYDEISDEKVSRIVEYLLQNSPLAKVDIINAESYSDISFSS